MGYVVVKDFNRQGCVCYKCDSPDLYVSLSDMLECLVDDSRIQVVCLSDPSMYGEYDPYEFIEDLGEFVKRALSM